jgi:hypothetical protein
LRAGVFPALKKQPANRQNPPQANERYNFGEMAIWKILQNFRMNLDEQLRYQY